MSNPSEAWLELANAIETWNHGDHEDLRDKRALRDAVMKYAAQAGASPSPEKRAPVSVNSGACFPNYGKAKGQPVAGASMADLEYYLRGCLRTLADESKSRWHDKERELAAVIRAEMAR